jgi:hypothetical protein
VPHQSEDLYLRNLVEHQCRGVIVSWAGPGQKGTGHINLHVRPPRSNLQTETSTERHALHDAAHPCCSLRQCPLAPTRRGALRHSLANGRQRTMSLSASIVWALRSSTTLRTRCARARRGAGTGFTATSRHLSLERRIRSLGEHDRRYASRTFDAQSWQRMTHSVSHLDLCVRACARDSETCGDAAAHSCIRSTLTIFDPRLFPYGTSWMQIQADPSADVVQP